MKKIKSYDPDTSSERFRKMAFKSSVIWIAALFVLMFAGNYIIKNGSRVYGGNLNIFSSKISGEVMLSDAGSGPAGGNIKVDVTSAEINDEKLTVVLEGRNCTDAKWSAHGDTFVISSFNTRTAERRYHYYSDDWSEFTVPAQSDFKYVTTFDVPGLKEKMDSGYVFTLSAFRDESTVTVDIILNDDSGIL